MSGPFQYMMRRRGRGDIVKVMQSLKAYLNTAYSPDREYVDGEVVKRNLGERPQSRVQFNICLAMGQNYPRLFVWPEQRVRTVPGRRCRVPDVCVTLQDPGIDVFENPPLICIEILSKLDRRARIVAKCDEYADFGVPYIWVIHPRLKKTYEYHDGALREVEGGALHASQHSISLSSDEIFRGL